MFPEEIVKKCLLLGSRPGDIVLDCCAGSGTTGLVAHQHGRNSVVMDISEEYVRMMQGRISGGSDDKGSKGFGGGSGGKRTASGATNGRPKAARPKSILGMPETKNETLGQQSRAQK
jgi:DNA methylase